MTEIRFHFNLADRAGYACRLLRKAQRHGGGGVVVTGSDETLGEIDRGLWQLGPAEFVPHAFVSDAASVPERLHVTTVWLAGTAHESPCHGTLVNLGSTAPRGFESFERLIELVSTDEADRQQARERWRGYQKRGYAIERHEVAA